MINFIVYLITNSIINFILLSYLNDRHQTKYEKRIYILIFVFSVFCISIINLFNMPILNLIYNILNFILIDFLCYIHENFFDYYKDIIYFFILIFIDEIAFFIVGLIYKSTEYITIFRSLSSASILLLCNMIARRYITIRKIEYVPIREIVIYLFITIFYIYVIYILSGVYNLLTDKILKVIIIIFIIGQILIDIIIYYYLNFVGLSYKMEKEIISAHQQLEIKKLYYENLKKAYEENQKIIHDFKNYLQTLEDAYKNESSKTESLKKQLYSKLDQSKMKYRTSSEILDFILMDKENKAYKENIEFIFRMEIIDISFISEMDIITIFGNLYDNAIEACKESEKVKYIETAIYKRGSMLLIRMENSCINKLQYNGKRIKSTKKGHDGIGIRNISQAVAKYNGVFNLKIISNKCISVISIPII